MRAATGSAATTKIERDRPASVRWSENDVERLIELWSTNLSNAEIAKRLGRQESAVAVKATRINLPRKSTMNRSTSSKARIRPCLKCSNPFHSEGPGNRICDPCKSGTDWQSQNDCFTTIGSY